MLKCKDIADLSSDYLDGTLPLRKRLAIRLHLMMCGHCRRYLKSLQMVITTLGRSKQPIEDEARVDKIIDKIKREMD
jgi:anti-sigma factor ChrR (cupin superfamily)